MEHLSGTPLEGTLLASPAYVRPGLKDKRSSLFLPLRKKFYSIDTCGKYPKHFRCVIYDPSKISSKHAPEQYFQNAQA